MNRIEAIETTIFNAPQALINEINNLIKSPPPNGLDFVYAIGKLGKKYALDEYRGDAAKISSTLDSFNRDEKNTIFGRLIHRFNLIELLKESYSDELLVAWNRTLDVNIQIIAGLFKEKYTFGRSFIRSQKEPDFVNHALAFPAFVKYFLSDSYNTYIFDASFWRTVSIDIDRAGDEVRETRFHPNLIRSLAEIHVKDKALLAPKLQDNAFILSYIERNGLQ